MVLLIYGVGHLVLTGLNIWWFGKMVAAVRKRFVPRRKAESVMNGNGNGVSANGKKKL